MGSTLTPSGWVVDQDVVDERKEVPRLTGAQIDALNARIAAGSNEFPTATTIIRIDDEAIFTKQGTGSGGLFINATGTLVDALTKTAASAPDGTSFFGYQRTAIAGAIPIDLFELLDSMPIRDVEFGCVGDGVADDTLKLNALMAAGLTLGRVVVGRVGATYKITDTVHFGSNADFGGCIFAAPASLAAPAVDVYGAAQLNRISIKFPTVQNNRVAGVVPTAGSIGIRIQGSRNCRFEFSTVYGFEENIQLYSNNGTTGFISYNNLYFNEIVFGAKINIHLKTELTGWVNQCAWFGGQFAQLSTDTAAFNTINLQITKADTGGNNPPNGHTFFGCSFEGAFTRTVKYNLNAGIVTSYFSCNTFINCRFEAAANMELSAIALYDTYVTCSGLNGATFVGGVYPNVLGGTRLFRHTTDISAIPGAAGFRTANSVPIFQAVNSGNAVALSAGLSGQINAGITAGGSFVTFHPTDPAKLFATTSVNTGGGVPKWECGDGTVAAPDYMGWFGNNDWRMKGSFTPVTDSTYALGSAARKWTTLSLSGGVGFYGSAPVAKQTLAAAATDAATTQTLANDIRAKLIAIGLMA